MGAAFDYDGKLLGEFTGSTKEEVFSELNKQFPEAAHIEIHALLQRKAELTKRRARNRRREQIAKATRKRQRQR